MVNFISLENKAKNLRRKVLDLAYQRKEGHIGGAFSIIDLMVYLFDEHMKKEDKFILSKGHACLPYFIILQEKGYNPKVGGHPEKDLENGIEVTTGSLGHGLPLGTGMALSRKIQNKSGNIYVIMSDAECQEGTTWESLLIASHHKLDNLNIIIDYNNLQTLGKTSEILSLGDFESIFRNMGLDVIRINGHSFREIDYAFCRENKGKTKVIIADTIKGKGVSFMENIPMWHTKIPDENQLKQAMDELK